MMDLEITFEEKQPWEALLDGKHPDDRVSAANLLTMLESADEETLGEALSQVDERNMVLDVSGLPKLISGQAAVRLRREQELVAAGLDPRSLEETDPLRLYLEEVAATPAFGDEVLLAQDAAAGKEAAREQLVNLGLSRVLELAQEYVGYGVLLLDLIQEGSLALWQATGTYSDGDYRAYRDRRVRNALAKTVTLHQHSSGIGQKMRAAMEDYRAVDQRLLSELGRNPTLEEIADALHMNVEEAEQVRKVLEDAYLVDRAKQPAQEEEKPDPEAEQAVEDTAYFQMRQRIEELLSVLDEQDAQILTLRFGLNRKLPMTPEETARQLNLAPEEVLEREKRALSHLRSDAF